MHFIDVRWLRLSCCSCDTLFSFGSSVTVGFGVSTLQFVLSTGLVAPHYYPIKIYLCCFSFLETQLLLRPPALEARVHSLNGYSVTAKRISQFLYCSILPV